MSSRYLVIMFIVGVFVVWLAFVITPTVTGSYAAGCQATSCKVVPCSTSMSAENGLHTSDDAIAAQIDYPLGCDSSIAKAP